MKRLTTLFAVLLAAAATLAAQGPVQSGRVWGGPGLGIVGAWPATRTPVTGAPYSGVETTQIQQTLQNGDQIDRKQRSKVYRDSQGRVRMEHAVTNPGNGQTHTQITIFDPVAGFVYALNPHRKIAFSKAVAPTPAGPGSKGRARRGPGGAEVKTEDLGGQTINGLAATGTRTTETIAAGAIGNQQPIQIIREVWGSTALKVPVLIKTTDPRFGNRTVQLINVTQSEPDPSLFQVPADYTVTTRPQGRAGGMMGREPRN
jgi:hypothetical protein